MGNLCGKQSKDNFATPGRTVGSAPAPSNNARASIPATAGTTKASRTASGPGRTVGGTGSSGDDPRSAAARAAEERANKTLGTGKLGRQLTDQKKKTDRAVLEEAARENRAHRAADEVADSRNWN